MSKLVIIGAHSAVGKALAEALEDRDLGAEIVKATTAADLGLGLDLIDETTLAGASVVFLAAEGNLAEGLANGADRLGMPVVDLTGNLLPDAPLVFPAFAAEVPRSGSMRVPLGMVSGVVAVLKALAPFGPTSARVVSLESAAAAGEPGIDELSAQARGIFTMQDAPSEQFYAPIAFSVLSSVGEEEDPFGPDMDFVEDVAEAVPDVELSVTRLRVATFTAEGAVIEIELSEDPGEEMVTDTLAAAKSLRASSSTSPSVLEAAERDDLLFGRVRVRGTRVDLFLASDRLAQGGAVPAALLAERLLASS